MTLSTGSQLAHYEISNLLGKGGMGEVYQAKDKKLGRDVAIKVLPEEFAKDADRVARFQREAKLLASLNHPNIASIYGLEEDGETRFLVLELVEGDTLADRLKHGAIPVEESLKLALQIAEALEAAHEKGVIHRDLKPANLKVTPDGKAKVLDFGLAKAFTAKQGEMILSDSPTLSVAATQQGIILGTAAYMSPEQAKGKSVDRKTDIWAFGCVLYEMLTGKAAFQGDELSEILASVIKGDTDLDLLPANIHPRVRELLIRCLQKEQKKRYADISEAQYEIEQALADPSGVFAQPVSAAEYRTKLQQMLPWIATAIGLTAVIIGFAVWTLKPAPPPEPRPVTRFEYELPEDLQLDLVPPPVAISRDGTKIAYAAGLQLFLKNLNELTASPIQGADRNPMRPFFSFDGQWIGYCTTENQLKKIPITGGVPVQICEGSIGSPSWGADDMILFEDRGGIKWVSANGGTPKIIVKAENEDFLSPQFLPDGKSILFTVRRESGLQVVVQSLESGERKDLLLPSGPAQYLPTGHLVYALDNNLFAIPFDLDRLETTGSSLAIVEGVFRRTANRATASAISDSGTLVYAPGTTQPATFRGKLDLVWVDRQGKVEKIDALSDYYTSHKISPDGAKVALTKDTEEDSSDIYVWDFNIGTTSPLTFNGNSTNPLWTPDGKRIVFVAGDEDKSGIYWKAADGMGKQELLALMPDGEFLIPRAWSDDGKTLAIIKLLHPPELPTAVLGRMMEQPAGWLRRIMRGGGGPTPKRSPGSEESSVPEEFRFSTDIGTLFMEGEHELKPLLGLDGIVFDLKISPDGRWIAYSSTRSGRPEIYVRPFPDMGSGGLRQISTGGATQCLWSPDGRQLLYSSRDGSVMAVDVETEPTFNCGKPEVIFNRNDIGVSHRNYFGESLNTSPDGKRFLMLKDAAAADDTPGPVRPKKIIIVTNWFEELKERVPVE